MAIVLTDNQNYADIADEIRAIDGGEETYLPSEMSTPLNAAASEITTQEGIIELIKAALIGKGGGGEQSYTLTLTQTYSGSNINILRNLVLEETGLTSFTLIRNDTPSESGYWLQMVIAIRNDYGDAQLLCRRTSTGSIIEWTGTTTQWSAESGAEFTVYSLEGKV